MTLRVRDTATLRTATEVRARKSDSTLVPVDRMMIRTTNGLSQFYRRGIRLSASPGSASGFGVNRTGPIYTNTVQIAVEGGTAPYTYSWATNSGIFVNSPTSAATSFGGNPPAIAGEIDGTATCTVTDSSGLSQTVTVSIVIQRESGA